MPNLSKQLSFLAIAQEVNQGQPALLDLLISVGLASPSDTVQGLKLLSPEQANFIRLKFGKAPIEAPKKPEGFAPKPPEKVTAPTKPVEAPEGLKTLESLSTEWNVKLADLGRIANIAKIAYGIEFKGFIDSNWEYLLGSVRGLLSPEYGGTGTKSPEQTIGEIQAQLKAYEPNIDTAEKDAIAADDSFAVESLRDYLGAVRDEIDLEHDAVVENFTNNVADIIYQKYESDFLSRMSAMKLAFKLSDSARRRHERNANQASLPWQERVKQLAGTAQRVTAIALSPVRSDKCNAASIVAAIAASNRP